MVLSGNVEEITGNAVVSAASHHRGSMLRPRTIMSSTLTQRVRHGRGTGFQMKLSEADSICPTKGTYFRIARNKVGVVLVSK